MVNRIYSLAKNVTNRVAVTLKLSAAPSRGSTERTDGGVNELPDAVRYEMFRRFGYFVTDLGSTNGTYVNGRRFEAGRLSEGDDLIIGGEDGELVTDAIIGDLTIGGTYSGGNGLQIATAGGAGIATGSAQVGVGVSDVSFVSVGGGGGDPDATGSSVGQLAILAGGAQGTGGSFSNFSVGTTNGPATSLGTAVVQGGIVGPRCECRPSPLSAVR